MRSKTEWAAIGKVVAPFGIHGDLKVFSLSDIAGRFTSLETVSVLHGTKPTSYTIERVRPYKGDTVLLKFVGIDDPTSADVLRNAELVIPLDQLAKLPPDSYYQHDILGLQVYTLQNRHIGSIVDILITGSNDVYVVKGPEGQQFLIPAIKSVIKQVDLIRRMMYIEPMSGLLDDDAVIDEQEESTGEDDKKEEEV
jgi:16S rRNA processing protein RimM